MTSWDTTFDDVRTFAEGVGVLIQPAQ